MHVGRRLFQRQRQIPQLGSDGLQVGHLRGADRLGLFDDGAHQLQRGLFPQHWQGEGGQARPVHIPPGGDHQMPGRQSIHTVPHMVGLFDVVQHHQPAGMCLQPVQCPGSRLVDIADQCDRRMQRRGQGSQPLLQVLRGIGGDPPRYRITVLVGVGVVADQLGFAHPAHAVHYLAHHHRHPFLAG